MSLTISPQHRQSSTAFSTQVRLVLPHTRCHCHCHPGLSFGRDSVVSDHEFPHTTPLAQCLMTSCLPGFSVAIVGRTLSKLQVALLLLMHYYSPRRDVVALPPALNSHISSAGCCWKEGSGKGIAMLPLLEFCFRETFLLFCLISSVTGPPCLLRPFQAGTSAKRDCSGNRRLHVPLRLTIPVTGIVLFACIILPYQVQKDVGAIDVVM